MQGPYADHVLDANDVCRNCFSLIRVERLDPVRGSGFADHELASRLSRHETNTSVDYHDGGDEPMHAKGVFCTCGVEGAHDRVWTTGPADRVMTLERFKGLIKNLLRTLESKGVTHARKTTIAVALDTYRSDNDVDAALAAGLEAGIATASANGTATETAVS